MSLLQQAEDLDDSHRKPESCERIEKSDDLSLAYYGTEIRTVDELLAHAKVDLKLWEVVEQRVNNWEVTGKKSRGQDESRRWLGDELWKTGNRQITVKLKRRAPKGVQDALIDLLKDVKPIATAKPRKLRSAGKQMLEIGLFDHHFGKRAWLPEVGMNYDLRIAESEFRSAIDDMLARVAGYNIDKIVFPIGNDFYHVNDFIGQTANLTRVSDSSTDDRFSLVFRTGCRAVQYAVERCLAVAPVELLYVPGNHDRHTAWFLTEWCGAIFKKNKFVRVFNEPGNRKYVQYGKTLLGYMHGDEVKHSDLPGLMAQECPQMWANTTFRSWRLGHWHKRKETRYVAGDTHQGVEVKIFPSLCGTDSWHYAHGFVGNNRMAECYLWDFDNGPIGNFVVHAKEPAVLKG